MQGDKTAENLALAEQMLVKVKRYLAYLERNGSDRLKRDGARELSVVIARAEQAWRDNPENSGEAPAWKILRGLYKDAVKTASTDDAWLFNGVQPFHRFESLRRLKSKKLGSKEFGENLNSFMSQFDGIIKQNVSSEILEYVSYTEDEYAGLPQGDPFRGLIMLCSQKGSADKIAAYLNAIFDGDGSMKSLRDQFVASAQGFCPQNQAPDGDVLRGVKSELENSAALASSSGKILSRLFNSTTPGKRTGAAQAMITALNKCEDLKNAGIVDNRAIAGIIKAMATGQVERGHHHGRSREAGQVYKRLAEESLTNFVGSIVELGGHGRGSAPSRTNMWGDP